MKTFLIALHLLLIGCAAQAATVTINCNAQVQGTGACALADNGEAGILWAFWGSLTDDAPGDPDVASDAIDFRDAVCAVFGIPAASCTNAAADGALRKHLVGWVKDFRKGKKAQALPAPTAPVLDAQGNP